MALIAEVTEVAGAVPVGTELVQLTEPVPEGPVACSGIDAVKVSPDVLVVSMTADRVAVLEPR